MSNIYSLLVDRHEPQETNQLKRKARKKLREIDALKQKKIKTPEEYAKIQEEGDWIAIACPVDSQEESMDDIYGRKEKQHNKTRRDLERKVREITLQNEKLLRKVRELSPQSEIHERKLREVAHQNVKLVHNLNDKNNKIIHLEKQLNDSNALVQELLRSRFESTRQLNGNGNKIKSILEKEIHEKSWKKVLFKLHPDKLSKHVGTELANEIAKIANELKPES